jgi:predicted nucleic acid-binding Zn ribbon protein
MRRMQPPRRRPSPVADVLTEVLQRVDPEQQMRAYRIWSFWNDEVGATIARRTQPARFRNGILFVTVATHSWMQELQFMKDTIRDKLNARLGAELVRDIFFISGTVETEPPRADAPAADVAGAPRRPLPQLPALADPALAAAFTRLLEARAKRQTRPRPGPAAKRR